MSRILHYKSGRNNVVITISLIVAIIITNSFIVFSPDENSRSYFSNLTSTLTVAAPMVIGFVMIFTYKKSLIKLKGKHQTHRQRHDQDIQSYDNNKMHLSICIFLVLWFAAHVIWTFQYQQSTDISIQDVLWLIVYGFLGFLLYRLLLFF